MLRSAPSDRFVKLTCVAAILFGLGYAGVSLALALSPSQSSATGLAELAAWLAPLAGLSVLLWIGMMMLRRRQRLADSMAQRADSRSTGRRTSPSTMQSQWKQPDPAPTWANTYHDTRERTTSLERNSQTDGWSNSVMQSNPLLHHASPPNSLQQNSLQSHTIAPGMQWRHASVPICWTLELLQELEWHRFDTVTARFFDSIGLDARPLEKGPDHEISLHVWQPGDPDLHAVVRTQAGAPAVDIAPVRALYAVMTRERLSHGFFVTGGRFTPDAVTAARGTGLFLIDGATLYKRIDSLPASQQEALLQIATEGDFRSPTCPQCGRKMALRGGDFKSFWRCTGYPDCKARMVLATDDPRTAAQSPLLRS